MACESQYFRGPVSEVQSSAERDKLILELTAIGCSELKVNVGTAKPPLHLQPVSYLLVSKGGS